MTTRVKMEDGNPTCPHTKRDLYLIDLGEVDAGWKGQGKGVWTCGPCYSRLVREGRMALPAILHGRGA